MPTGHCIVMALSWLAQVLCLLSWHHSVAGHADTTQSERACLQDVSIVADASLWTALPKPATTASCCSHAHSHSNTVSFPTPSRAGAGVAAAGGSAAAALVAVVS